SWSRRLAGGAGGSLVGFHRAGCVCVATAPQEGSMTLADILPQWLPPAASANAQRTDALLLSVLALCGTVALVICVLIIVFCVRYRRGSKVARKAPRQLRVVEVLWTVLPLLLFIPLCGWAAYDYLWQNRAPADAMPVFVVAKQWMWTLEHSNGKREINQ